MSRFIEESINRAALALQFISVEETIAILQDLSEGDAFLATIAGELLLKWREEGANSPTS